MEARMQSLKKYIVISLVSVIAVFLTSCGSKYIGWGVLYIEDTESNLKAGTMMPILQDSEIRDVYTVEADGSADIARWKIAFFEKESEASGFAEDYRQWTDLYAVNLLNGLSIREEADGSSERVYKLREGQIIKIIGRDNEMVNIADHDGYWYLVLTEDGTKGYCFDKNLRIYDIKDSGAENGAALDTALLEIFYSRVFRPEYYYEMVRDSMVDLSRFRKDYGIFSYPEENRIELITQKHRIEFPFTGVSQNNSGRFIFEGSGLQVEVRSENRIAVYYYHDDKEYAEVMVFINEIDTVIEVELERRQELFDKIAELGAVSSSAYGRIRFGENKTFNWQDKRRLVPNVIPESADDNGKILLNYFPGLNLRDKYDGVISFSFDGVPGGGLINFLFQLSDLGIKLVHVPGGDISKGIVEQESTSPLVIFMSGAGE